jgi:predicted transcriptional regulator
MRKAIECYLEAEEKREEEIKITNERWNNFSLTGESVKHSKIKNWASKL